MDFIALYTAEQIKADWDSRAPAGKDGHRCNAYVCQKGEMMMCHGECFAAAAQSDLAWKTRRGYVAISEQWEGKERVSIEFQAIGNTLCLNEIDHPHVWVDCMET